MNGVDNMAVKNGDKVKVEYEGKLDDGTVFDSSEKHGKPLELEIGTKKVIPGFENAIIGMKKGEEKEIKLEPKDLSSLFYKSKIYVHNEDFQRAAKLLDDNLEHFPEKEIDLLVNKAFLLKKMNKYDDALKIINELWKKFPDNLDLLNSKLYFHLYLGQKKEAIENGELLTSLDPNDGNYHDSFGEVLTEFEEYERAIQEIQKALELEPFGWYSYNSYFQMAICYKELGNYDLARESLEKGKKATETCFCDIDMRKEWEEKKQKLLAQITELEKKK